MPNTDHTTLAVADKACVVCKGAGTTSERDEGRGVNIIERCWMCGGHGCRTIVLDPKP